MEDKLCTQGEEISMPDAPASSENDYFFSSFALQYLTHWHDHSGPTLPGIPWCTTPLTLYMFHFTREYYIMYWTKFLLPKVSCPSTLSPPLETQTLTNSIFCVIMMCTW